MMALADPFARDLKRRLVGRKIVKTEARPFSDGRGGKTYDPRITLDDGTTLTFVVEETDDNEYGVRVVVNP